MFNILNSVCQDPNVLKLVWYAKVLLKIILFTVPMILPIRLMIDLYKNIVSGREDVIKENNKKIIQRIVATILLFMIYPVINLIFGLEAINQVGYIECWNNATSLDKIDSMKKTLTLNTASDELIDGDNIYTCSGNSCDFDLPKVYKTGYEFIGWSTSSNCLNVVKDKITITDSNVVIYACFTKKDSSSSGNQSDITSGITKTPNTIFVGDSRTVGMCGYLENSMLDSEQCVAKGSQALSWFKSTAISQIDSILKKNSSKVYNIVIDLGVNDLNNGDAFEYAKKYNELKNVNWSKHNLIIVSVTPVDERKYTKPKNFNTTIEKFNKSLKQNINNNIIYCDIYDEILTLVNSDTNATSDSGLHYKRDSYKKIYQLKKKCLS